MLGVASPDSLQQTAQPVFAVHREYQHRWRQRRAGRAWLLEVNRQAPASPGGKAVRGNQRDGVSCGPCPRDAPEARQLCLPRVWPGVIGNHAEAVVVETPCKAKAHRRQAENSDARQHSSRSTTVCGVVYTSGSCQRCNHGLSAGACSLREGLSRCSQAGTLQHSCGIPRAAIPRAQEGSAATGVHGGRHAWTRRRGSNGTFRQKSPLRIAIVRLLPWLRSTS